MTLQDNASGIVARLDHFDDNADYPSAESYVADLPLEAQRQPPVALAIGRLWRQQGRFDAASDAYDAATPSGDDRGTALLLAMEQALLTVVRTGNPDPLPADKVWAAAEQADLSADELALVELVHIRVMLVAGLYGLIAPSVAETARDRLPIIATTLADAGRTKAALAARLAWAKALTVPAQRDAALRTLAQDAHHSGASGLAGDALLTLAERLLAAGAPTDEVTQAVDAAADAFDRGRHVCGPVHVSRVRALCAVDRDGAPWQILAPFLEDYQALSDPLSEVTLLSRLSELALGRGEVSSGLSLRRRSLTLAQQCGMGLTHNNFRLAYIDQFLATHRPQEAISVADTALADAPVPIFQASLHQLLATATARSGDGAGCLKHGQQAIELFNDLGMADAASAATSMVVDELLTQPGSENWDEATTLLHQSRTTNIERAAWAGAAQAQEQLARIALLRFHATGTTELLDEARRELVLAESLTQRVKGPQQAARLGSVWQLRGQLEQLEGDITQAINAWQTALSVYVTADLVQEAARCRLMIGTLHLDRADDDLDQHVAAAEAHLQGALELFVQANLLDKVAEARVKLAQLYVKAAPRVAPTMRERILDMAQQHLGEAERNCDQLRRAQSEDAVRYASLHQTSQQLYEVALDIAIRHHDDAPAAWQWAQRAKTRALIDILEEIPGPRVRLSGVPEVTDVSQLLTPERSCVCVDWVSLGDQLWLLTVRPGQRPQLWPLTITLDVVRQFVEHNLSSDSFHRTLRDIPELLNAFNALIEPLNECTERGDLLVLSPIGALHALPLHALELDGDSLLERNPVVYSSSLSLLQDAITRRGAHPEGAAAVFGDPHGDDPKAAGIAEDIAGVLHTEAVMGKAVTREAFTSRLARNSLIHFQGPAHHDPQDPLGSHLVLAGDAHFTTRDILDLPYLHAGLVTLGSCDSPATIPGQQPLSLIPAFLSTGAESVLATLWPVYEPSAAQAMHHFYELLTTSDGALDKARALQAAALKLKVDERFIAPYHWAPFVLHGAW